MVWRLAVSLLPLPSSEPVERSNRLHTFFKERTCASESARGSRGGSRSSLIPFAGSPAGKSPGLWAFTQVVKAESDAR